MKKNQTEAAAEKKAHEKSEKKFRAALLDLEKIAQERVLDAADPFSTYIKMVNEIRQLADRVEKEAESVDPNRSGAYVR